VHLKVHLNPNISSFQFNLWIPVTWVDLFSDIPPLRLVNGTDRCSGRVEVRHDNQWGTVCDDEWDIKDAEVVCRSMDCGTAQSSKNSAFFGQGQGDIWLDDVDCFGNETSLFHCRHPSLGENNCGHGEDAGVVCSGIILLITLLLALFTLVSRQCLKWLFSLILSILNKLLYKNTFFSCISIRISIKMTQVLLLVFQLVADYIPFAANIRLINGTDQCSGRLEFYRGLQWSSAASVDWGMNEAAVVCREMNCGDPVTLSGSYGEGGKPTWYRVSCKGRESSLTQCSLAPYDRTSQDRTPEASVKCTGKWNWHFNYPHLLCEEI